MTDRSGPGWNDVDRIFAEAMDLPPDERPAFVDRACGSDAGQLEAVSRLLAAVDSSEGWLEAPGADAARRALEDLGDRVDPPPGHVGAYRIVSELGRGGMGTVYLGERAGGDFEQRVAVKVLRRGLDTADIVRRFMRERDILGRLTHPGIARLIDGGATEDGRPYLVMEYVDGEPITRYCDRTRRTIRQRLELFLEAADAVRAAHENLVVHRDLKPSNLFVTRGRVKLLDFGIAKLLGPEAGDDEPRDLTRAGATVLTPEIASPEQRRGERVTTATDIYQLGVLLYQLLAGCRPTVAGGDCPPPSLAAGRMDRASDVASARATRPDRLRRVLRGDLDTIALTALHEDPERRYASVDRLAADVRRYLDGQIISARPDTMTYRARTFLRRRPWVAPVGALLAAGAIVYGLTLVRYTRRLEVERTAAERQATRAEQSQQFLVDLFRSPDPYEPADPERGRKITVVQALDVGAKRLETELTDEPDVRESLLATVADVYQNLGVLDRALPLREEALSLEEARSPSSPAALESLGRLALIRAELGQPAEAQSLYEKRLALARTAQPPAPAEVAAALIDLGVHLVGERHLDEARKDLDEAVAIGARNPVPVAELAEAHRALSDIDGDLNQNDAALKEAEAALQLRIQANGKASVEAALAHVTLAQALGALDRVDEAEQQFAAGLAVLDETLGPDHRLTMTAVNNLAVLRQNAGNLTGALDLQRRVLESRRRVNGEHSRLVADAYQNLGTTLAHLGQLDEARDMHEQAARVYREAVEPGSYYLALPALSLSNIDLAQHHYARAEQSSRAALAILQKALPAGHYVTAVARCRVARALVGEGAGREAQSFFDQAVEVLKDTSAVPEYRSQCLEAAIDFYDRAGDADEARTLRNALGG